MSMSKLLALVLTLFGLVFSGVDARAVTYVYADVTDFASSIMIDTAALQGAIGDRGARMEMCSQSDAFKCFEMEGMIFAIPRKFDAHSDRSSWEFRGHTFNASRAQGVMILGTRYDVFFVDSINQTAPIRFWYSPRAGMIAVKGLQPNQDRVFLLQSRCGFASASSCK